MFLYGELSSSAEGTLGGAMPYGESREFSPAMPVHYEMENPRLFFGLVRRIDGVAGPEGVRCDGSLETKYPLSLAACSDGYLIFFRQGTLSARIFFSPPGWEPCRIEGVVEEGGDRASFLVEARELLMTEEAFFEGLGMAELFRWLKGEYERQREDSNDQEQRSVETLTARLNR